MDLIDSETQRPAGPVHAQHDFTADTCWHCAHPTFDFHTLLAASNRLLAHGVRVGGLPALRVIRGGRS